MSTITEYKIIAGNYVKAGLGNHKIDMYLLFIN